MKRIFSATINSLHGLIYGFRTEAALREEIVILAAAVLIAIFLAPNLAWYVAMIGVLLTVLAVEFLNTAIEKLADRLTTAHDPQIGRVKDLGSAAVGVALVVGTLFWVFAIAERIGAI